MKKNTFLLLFGLLVACTSPICCMDYDDKGGKSGEVVVDEEVKELLKHWANKSSDDFIKYLKKKKFDKERKLFIEKYFDAAYKVVEESGVIKLKIAGTGIDTLISRCRSNPGLSRAMVFINEIADLSGKDTKNENKEKQSESWSIDFDEISDEVLSRMYELTIKYKDGKKLQSKTMTPQKKESKQTGCFSFNPSGDEYEEEGRCSSSPSDSEEEGCSCLKCRGLKKGKDDMVCVCKLFSPKNKWEAFYFQFYTRSLKEYEKRSLEYEKNFKDCKNCFVRPKNSGQKKKKNSKKNNKNNKKNKKNKKKRNGKK